MKIMGVVNVKNSKGHHYIPIFFIKNFTNVNGLISIYDKIDDKHFEASPDNIFKEKHRNTFKNKHGGRPDAIEQIYTQLDGLFAQVVKKVTVGDHLLNGEDLQLLLYFAYIMKWRVPQYDESFRNAQDFFSVDDLGLGLKYEGARVEFELESFFDTEFHQELKRFLLAIQPFRFSKDFRKIYNNSFIIQSEFPALLGDCPVIEATVISNETFEDFVFSFSPHLTLVHSKRVNKLELQYFLENGKIEKVNKFIKDFSIARDLSVFALSKRFTGYNDSNYFHVILDGYNEMVKLEKLKGIMNATVFNRLYNYKSYF